MSSVENGSHRLRGLIFKISSWNFSSHVTLRERKRKLQVRQVAGMGVEGSGGATPSPVPDDLSSTFSYHNLKVQSLPNSHLLQKQYFCAFPTAAAKPLRPCPTLCDPIDGSPPGSTVPGILQARTLEWVAISFSNVWKWSRSVVSDSVWPHGLQPTRLLRPWDFPGKSTGVGCHCLFLVRYKSQHWSPSSHFRQMYSSGHLYNWPTWT